VKAGERCEKLLGKKIVNVSVKDVELDEIWHFVFEKQKLGPCDDASLTRGASPLSIGTRN